MPERLSSYGVGLSSWAARQKAEELGYPVNAGQFRSYDRWGLLGPRPANGRWPAGVVDRLVTIRRTQVDANSPTRLCRRTLVLHCVHDFTVPPDRLREALRKTLGVMSAAKKKMTALNAAVVSLANYLDELPDPFSPGPSLGEQARARRGVKGRDSMPRTVRAVSSSRRSSLRLPLLREWPRLLTRADNETLERHVRAASGIAQTLTAYSTITKYDATTIPFEEQVVLLVIRGLLIPPSSLAGPNLDPYRR
jgi:hypothetical protein